MALTIFQTRDFLHGFFMSKRLAKLKRQKQLIEEHLFWLEQEIASESGESIPAPASTTEPVSPATRGKSISFPQPETPATAAFEENSEKDETEIITEQLIAQYGHVSTRRQMDPRLGLILFFGGILGFLSLVVFLFYWFGYR